MGPLAAIVTGFVDGASAVLHAAKKQIVAELDKRVTSAAEPAISQASTVSDLAPLGLIGCTVCVLATVYACKNTIKSLARCDLIGTGVNFLKATALATAAVAFSNLL